MTPVVMIVTLGGILLLLTGFVWLLYRLGNFQPTARERRSWVITGAVLLAWVVFLAFVGPLPPLLSVLPSAGALGLPSGHGGSADSLENMPADSRVEVARTREWMRMHPGLLIGLGAAFTVLMVVWALAVVFVTRSS